MIGWLVNTELLSTWREVVVAEIEVLAQHLCGGFEEKHRKFGEDGQSGLFEARISKIGSRSATHCTVTFGVV
jgi:hypothetical protein